MTTLEEAVNSDAVLVPAEPKTGTIEKIRSDKFMAEVRAALPSHVDPASFVRHAASLVAANDKLKVIAAGGPNTDPHSILTGIMRAAALGLDLDPTLGQAWLVPRRVRGVDTAVFQVGYQGYLELVLRSGRARRVEVERVYSLDHFEAVKGSNGHLTFVPDWFGERGDLIGWYALVELDGGVVQWATMSLKAMQSHRDQYAPKYKGDVTGPWDAHFEAMGDKTAFLQLVRWLPKSTEMATALSTDEDAQAVMASVTPDADVIDAEEADA
jgi:recombination protein RecT